MKIPLDRCFRCAVSFAVATRSPHDEDRCTSCDPALQTPDDRIAMFVRDCFQPRTAL
jgi:hypothetical protein